MNNYYKLPLNLQSILEKKDLQRCELKESIAQHIHLILMTQYEEFRYDRTFGSEIWEQDFEMLKISTKWNDRIAQSLQICIVNQEPRLKDPVVKIAVGQEEFHNSVQGIRMIKKRMSVTVNGKITETNDLFTHKEVIYISPISID